MEKFISAPEDAFLSSPESTFTLIDLAAENPDLHHLLLLHGEEAARAVAAPQTAGQWYRSGAGPAPTQGGVWVGGSVLQAFSTPPASGIVSSFNYSYDNTHYRGWGSQISVRLVIQNYAGTQTWAADITAAATGSVGATGLGIPAQCVMQFQMKVGNLVVSLYQPPYISTAGSYVLYNY